MKLVESLNDRYPKLSIIKSSLDYIMKLLQAGVLKQGRETEKSLENMGKKNAVRKAGLHLLQRGKGITELSSCLCR